MGPEIQFTPDMTCTLNKDVFMPITNQSWLIHMLSYNLSTECCDVLYTALLHLQSNDILCLLEMTQTPYVFVPYLILASSEYISTLSQIQILNFPDHIHSRGPYSSAQHYCTLFNNPNSHRTVKSFVITCSENGRNLFKANLNSLLFGKFRGLWTKE